METQATLNLRLFIAVTLTIVGCGLLIAGFIVPPLGIVDNSILIAFGEISTFIGAILGIDYNYRYKKGCGCVLESKTRVPKAKCIINKW